MPGMFFTLFVHLNACFTAFPGRSGAETDVG